ncbi:MAG: GntR family transcriptional regulator [Firmicutes bacterium]|nr:GntR family transcriptional regulator [Bacillota bacterium]
MNISFDNNIPIYIQLLDYIKAYIISEQIKSGEKLPSVRELASMFKVNPNTIQKALSELEDIGLIYTERTNGKYVTTDKKLIAKIKNEYALKIANEFLDNMQKIGINNEEALNYLVGKEEK